MDSTGDFSFTRVADELGLGRLSDGDPGLDPAILRQLYQHARGELGTRLMFERDPTFKRGWLNLASPDVQNLVSAFVPLDEGDGLKAARSQAKTLLQAVAWNDVLGIDDPPIVCVVKIHGAKWGLRFEAKLPALRGREIVNEELPPIPAGDPNPEDDGDADEADGGDPGCAATSDGNITDILGKGGMLP